MEKQEIVQLVKEQLPALLEESPELERWIEQLTAQRYANRQQTESRFDQLLGELRRDREEQSRKGAEQNRKWEDSKAESERKWAEQNRKWEESKAESERKWAEQNEKWAEQNRKWEESKAESDRKWAEQNRKWEESKAESDRKWAEQTEQNKRLWLEVGEQKSRLDRKIGALGARWGIGSERAFRHALAAVLTESFGVEVLNINEYDDAGEVFGRPDQIELDIIVRNGTLIIFELKSSTDRSQLYVFSRKIAFYEKHHQRTADRKILVSPFIHPRAQELAQELGIETYGDSSEVDLEFT
ncbi:MAG: PD-(D/E)XK nuclease family protein [bacterium]